MPEFESFRPDGTGILVILLDDEWYTDARLEGVESFFYGADPLEFGITFANDSPDPFQVQLADVRDDKVLAVDVLLSTLPKEIRVRLQTPSPDELHLSFYGRSEGPINDFNIQGSGLFCDEITGEIVHIEADTTIPVWPMEIRLDYLTTPDQVFDLAWRATTGFGFADTTAEATIVTPPGELRVDAALETGALPPLGAVSFTDTDGGEGGTRREVQYTTPAADPADGFPTPTIPAYDVNALTNVEAGATISTQAMRDDNVEIRGYVNLNVPVDIAVAWEDNADEELIEVDADVCPDTNPNCASSILDATALYGPPTGDSGLDLLSAPAEPALPGDVDDAVEDFEEFRPGNGARIEILDEALWYGDVRLEGLHHVTYKDDPQDITVDMADSGQPFAVQILVATLTAEDDEGVDRRQVLWLDGLIDDLPTLLSARIEESDGAGISGEGGNPWLWVNTEDPAITDVNTVDFDVTDPPGARPVLNAHLRYGDIDYLGGADELAPGERPFGDRTENGADVWAHVTPDVGRLALDVGAQLEIPRHVALWKPASIGCNELSDDVDSCQDQPVYEIDDTQTVDLEFKTTSGELGDANADVRLIFGDIDFDIVASIETVPGQAAISFEIASNQRLPWTGINLGVDANAPLGDVTAEVFDLGETDGRPNATCYRKDGGLDPPGSSKSHPCNDLDNPEDDPDYTSNYGIVLENVPASLAVNARIVGLEARLTPGAGDPGNIETDAGGLGYVHAVLDLQGADNTILLDVAQLAGGALSAIMRADSGISGFINGRMDHISIGGSEVEDPNVILEGLPYLLGGGAVVGLVFGPGIGVLTFGIGLIVFALLDGDFEFNPDLDFDLPVYAEFDNVTDLRVGVRGTTVSLDERHDGSGDPMLFGARQRVLPTEEGEIDFSGSNQKDGIFHHVRRTRSGEDHMWGWTSALDDIPDDPYDPNDVDEFNDIGIYDYDICADGDQDEDPNCYNDDDVTNIASLTDHPAPSRGGGFTSSNMMWDPFLPKSIRGEIDGDHVFDGTDLGVEFYKGIAEQQPAFENEDFTIPELQDVSIRDNTESLAADLTRTDQPIGMGFVLTIINNVCEPPDDPDSNTARGNDGTLYRIVLLCQEVAQEIGGVGGTAFTPDLLKGVALNALLPNNGNGDAGDTEFLRWNVALPEPPGYDPQGNNSCETAFSGFDFPDPDDDAEPGDTVNAPATNVECEVEADIQPQPDGSVQVTLTTTRTVTGDVSTGIFSSEEVTVGPEEIGSVRGWIDASGHPAFHLEDAAEVPNFGAASVEDTDGDGSLALDACDVAGGATPNAIPCSGGDLDLPAGHSVRWVFGDGQVSDPITGGSGDVTHQYPSTAGTDRYLAILVQFDDDEAEMGEVVNKRYIEIEVDPRP